MCRRMPINTHITNFRGPGTANPIYQSRPGSRIATAAIGGPNQATETVDTFDMNATSFRTAKHTGDTSTVQAGNSTRQASLKLAADPAIAFIRRASLC